MPFEHLRFTILVHINLKYLLIKNFIMFVMFFFLILHINIGQLAASSQYSGRFFNVSKIQGKKHCLHRKY